jgi:type II secretory pathway pseudopilin PulG
VETSSWGYTIIEVMIVLAVSGMMFVIAAGFIGGKQARTAFNDGVNQLAASLQDTIEQVSDGKYSDVPLHYTCNGPSVNPGGAYNGQGTSSSCVFLGKIIHFTENDATDYETFSIIGSRLDAGVPSITPAQAGATSVTELTTQAATPHSLDVKQINITDIDGSFKQSYGIGFLQSMGSFDNTGVTLKSGSTGVNLYYVNGVGINLSSSSAAGLIKNNLRQASKVDMCITDGTRYADILLGDNGNQLAVSVKMNGTTPCP